MPPLVDTAPRLDAELRQLARQGATGALEVAGAANGTIYLDGGQLTFAESSAVPGLAARLVNSRLLSPDQWNGLAAAARQDDRSRSAASAYLRAHCQITMTDLEAVLRSAIVDAVLSLDAAPEAPPGPRERRFAPRLRHWAGSLLRLDVAAIQAELTRRAGALAGDPIPPDARPALCDTNARWSVIDREQWRVACLIDGTATIRELAWEHGLALHETAERVGELVRAGLCAFSVPDSPAQQPPRTILVAPGPDAAITGDSFLPAPVGAGLPAGAGAPLRRLPRRVPPSAAGLGPRSQVAPTRLDLLRQVQEGLRRLD